MPTQDEIKDKIKESYLPDNPKKKPATLKYIAVLAIFLLLAVLVLMVTKIV